MRFEELNPAAFGHFTDYPVTFENTRSFHVLFGNNEAGKSTMLRSITQLLYGIPHNSKDSFIHSNANLRIKGRISNSSGDELTFVRRKGKSKTILAESGESLPDNVLYPYLNVLSEETFRSMFALNHETLREGGESLLESNGSVGESLFAAASGINAVKKIMQGFDSESKELYKSGGSKPKINELLKKEKELTRRVMDSQMLARQWKQLEDEYNDGKKELEELKRHYLEVDATLKKLSKLKQAAPILMERESLIEQLAEYEELPNLPVDITIQREQAVNESKHAQESEKLAQAEIITLEEKLTNLQIDEQLLACESLIQSLFSNLGAYEKEYKDLYVNEAKAEQAINRINSILRRLGYGGLEEVNIEDFRIAVSRKERIRTLYKSYGIIKETIKDTNKRLHNLELAAESKHSEWQSLGEVKDIGTLKLVLDHVQIEGNIENTITVLTQELKELLEVTKEELKFLPLWEGSVEEFESFYVPILEETILQYMEQLDRINEERANLGRTIKLEKTNIQEAEKSIADLEAISVIPTEDDLEISRHIRNQGWEIIKKKLKGESVEKKLLEDYRNELEVEEKFEQDLRKTDEISDIMWRESAKVGMKDKSLQDIERSKSKISEAEKQLELFENELIQFNQQWKELWAPFNINPLTPAEMKEWVRKYKIIKQNQAEYKKKQHLWTELTETRTAVLGRLFGALSEVSKIDTGLSEWTLADLIREAKSFINSETERINEKKSLEKEWLGKVSDLEQVKNELKIKQQELINWKTMWEEAISPLQLNNEATIDYTLEILDIYDQLTITYDEWCDINTKVQASKSYVKEYLDHIQRVASILQEPDPIDIQSYVHQLSNNLQEHKKAKQNQTEWHEQLRKRKNEYTFAKEKKKLAENRLHELLKTAGVATIEEMLIIEEKSGQKQKLVGEITHLEKLLLEIGNGLSIEEIDKLKI